MKPIILDFPMPITTPRLLIRAGQSCDGAMFNEAILESFESLHRFMDWAKEKPSLAESESIAKLAAANWIFKKREEPWLQLCILDKETNQMIGAAGFHNYIWEVPRLEMGYWIRTSRAQQGLMTEAINAMTQYAFRQLGVKRITITCDKDNVRSKSIPERLGYVLESTLINHRRKPVTAELSDTLEYARYDSEGLPDLKVTWGNEIDCKTVFEELTAADIDEIVTAFKAIGWNKPASIYQSYLKEQSEGIRSVIVAKVDGKFCGYVTLKYQSEYPGFHQQGMPEISDLNVLPEYRNTGIGTSLINECEKLADDRGCQNIGIGVGMTADYGNAQRLYVQLGYIPDGQGLHYKNQPLHYGDKADVDDDLVLYFTKCLSNK